MRSGTAPICDNEKEEKFRDWELERLENEIDCFATISTYFIFPSYYIFQLSQEEGSLQTNDSWGLQPQH